MNEAVVDTNVWIMAHKSKDLHTTPIEVDCAIKCVSWLTGYFDDPEHKLVADLQWKILDEYWTHLKQEQSLASQILANLQQSGRIHWANILFDRDGQAVLPSELGLDEFDPSDKKFIAAALACDPHPPIYNAVDSDWQKHAAAIKAAGITVVELCPQCIEAYRGVSNL